MKLFIILLLTLTTSINVSAANSVSEKISIYVDSKSEDDIGRRLVYKIKEQVRKSTGMKLSNNASDALFIVHMTTMDPDKDLAISNSRTIYSVVWTAKGTYENPLSIYLGLNSGFCGKNILESCAEGLIASADEYSYIFDNLSK